MQKFVIYNANYPYYTFITSRIYMLHHITKAIKRYYKILPKFFDSHAALILTPCIRL